jgi:hypothetical protein
MPTVAINIQITSIGTDALTFTIADNVSGIIATNVPRTSLLGGIVVDADSTASEITIAANAPCESDVTIPIDFKPCGGPTPPPPPPPESVWYVLERCSDANTFYSIEYPGGTFDIGERVSVTVGEITYTYVIIGELLSNPGGGLLTLTGTGIEGCPVTVANVFGYMEPCIGGTIDDYQGAAVFLNSPVSVDTTFDVNVDWVFPGNTCAGFVNSNSFSIFIPAGEASSNFNACYSGYYISSGAVICGACINSCDNPEVDFSTTTC